MAAILKEDFKVSPGTVCQDVYTDPSRNPILNLIVTTKSGSFSMGAVDCSGSSKDTDFIVEKTSALIESIGACLSNPALDLCTMLVRHSVHA